MGGIAFQIETPAGAAGWNNRWRVGYCSVGRFIPLQIERLHEPQAAQVNSFVFHNIDIKKGPKPLKFTKLKSLLIVTFQTPA